LDGSFSFPGKNFAKYARNVYVHDCTLYAELSANGAEQWYPDKVGIELHIPDDLSWDGIAIRPVEYHASHSPKVPNERSRLAVRPQENIHNLRLISGFVLAAECMQPDGIYATSYVDLDALVENSNGRFRRRGNNFSKSAEDIRLNGTTLQAKLTNIAGGKILSDQCSRLAVRKERSPLWTLALCYSSARSASCDGCTCMSMKSLFQRFVINHMEH
jgi:hypothetical protein